MRWQASKYDGWDVETITAISQAESQCRATATGDKHLTYKKSGRIYGYSVGAMQVRILPDREHCDSHNLILNVRCAHRIWQDQGYGAWTKYLTGEYKRYLNDN